MMKKYIIPVLSVLLLLSLGLNLFLLRDDPRPGKEAPTLKELQLAHDVIGITVQGLLDAEQKDYFEPKGYAQVRALLDDLRSSYIDSDNREIVIGIHDLTQEKEEAYRRFVFDAEFLRFVEGGNTAAT